MNIFDYTDYSPFINETLKQRAIVLGSMSEVAQSLGYKNSSLLSMIISGKRKPSSDFIHRFSEHFNLSMAEKNDLENKLRGGADTSPSSLDTIYLDANLCQGLAKWPFLFIVNMMSLKGTVLDERRTAEYLGIEEAFVSKTIKDILVLKILKTNESGQLGPKAIFKLAPSADGVKKALLESDYISMALERLREIGPQSGFIAGELINIDSIRVTEARKEVNDFILSFQKKFYHTEPGEMFRLNTQLFKI